MMDLVISIQNIGHAESSEDLALDLMLYRIVLKYNCKFLLQGLYALRYHPMRSSAKTSLNH